MAHITAAAVWIYDNMVYVCILRTPLRAGTLSCDTMLCCRGTLHLKEGLIAASGLFPDSYLAVGEWGKGLAFVNGFNLGWYWPLVGPANTLYVPGALLKPGANTFVLLEIERAPHRPTGALPYPVCIGVLVPCLAALPELSQVNSTDGIPAQQHSDGGLYCNRTVCIIESHSSFLG